MRQLEEENLRLKKLVADLSLDKAMLQDCKYPDKADHSHLEIFRHTNYVYWLKLDLALLQHRS